MRVNKIVSFSVVILLISVVFAGAVTVLAAADKTPTLSASCIPTNPLRDQTYTVYGWLKWSGTPIPDKQVLVYYKLPGQSRWNYFKTVTTNVDGRYDFSSSTGAAEVNWMIKFAGDSSYSPITGYITIDTKITRTRVMFRDDDVTPWSMDGLEAVNQVQIDEGVPVTLSVIPALSFPGQSISNVSIVSSSKTSVNSSDSFNDYLRSRVSSGQSVVPTVSSSETFVDYLRPLVSSGAFELAQHGYEHCDNSKLYGITVPTEFRGMPYYEQERLIADGRSLMQNAFGVAPTTFVPPFNTGDENTLKVLNELGFTVYCSYPGEFGSTTSVGGLTITSGRAIDIDTPSTYNSLVSQTEPLLKNTSVNDIVVTYHNWKYENSTTGDVNTTMVNILSQYIQWLKTNNVEFTTLSGAASVTSAQSGQQITALTLATSHATPAVNVPVTFTVTLKGGSTALSSKSVAIYHYLNGVRYNDATKTTNANGQITYTTSFGSAGKRTYHASFAGDSEYAASSDSVTVNVAATSTTITASNTTPAVNQPVTLTVTLKSGTTGLSEPVHLWCTVNGVRIERGTFDTVNGVYQFTGPFSTKGEIIYHAEFAGDSEYPASSGIVTVNVGGVAEVL
jgi:peptidoglycan/xylan/chitin deacetylase (PgdA/CDA1 family)